MVELADVAGAEYAFERHEHAEVRAGLDRVNSTARAVARATLVDVAGRVRPIETWLTGVLMPHVAWETAVIFPEVNDLSGHVWPTSLMAFDHMQITHAANLVETDIIRLTRHVPTNDERYDVYEHLIALETLIRAHLEREDEFLLPILTGNNS